MCESFVLPLFYIFEVQTEKKPNNKANSQPSLKLRFAFLENPLRIKP